MICFVAYDPTYRDDLAALWHASWLSSDPVVFPDDTIERLKGRVDEEIANGWDVTLALDGDELVGFLALKRQENWLDQLFIAPSAQGRNIGAQLLDRAKSVLPGGFKLRTSILNQGARRFYARHGLQETEVTRSPFRNTEVVVISWKGEIG
jgi:GNAT superfamily N-acetyltransferase